MLAIKTAVLSLLASGAIAKSLVASFDLSKTYPDFTSIFEAIRAQKSPPEVHRRDASLPSGYTQVFGPIGAANNAPGYMGFTPVVLGEPGIANCAYECDNAPPDANGGECKFFNLWTAVVNGTPSSLSTCALYYLPTDASTATNTGQGDLVVTQSSGYARISYIPDGTFEGYTCTFPTPRGGYDCYTESFGGWLGTSAPGGYLDATIVNDAIMGTAHIGYSYAQLGGQATNQYPGTLSVTTPILTVEHDAYSLSFFIRAQESSQPGFADLTPVLNITWNGVVVDTITGFHPEWEFQRIYVEGTGNDTLSFTGGFWPNYIQLDDIYLLSQDID